MPDLLGCPRCSVPFSDIHARKGSGRNCSSCGGTWFSHAVDIPPALAMVGAIRSAAKFIDPVSVEQAALLVCAECEQTMDRLVIREPARVEIDHCIAHGPSTGQSSNLA